MQSIGTDSLQVSNIHNSSYLSACQLLLIKLLPSYSVTADPLIIYFKGMEDKVLCCTGSA